MNPINHDFSSPSLPHESRSIDGISIRSVPPSMQVEKSFLTDLVNFPIIPINSISNAHNKNN